MSKLGNIICNILYIEIFQINKAKAVNLCPKITAKKLILSLSVRCLGNNQQESEYIHKINVTSNLIGIASVMVLTVPFFVATFGQVFNVFCENTDMREARDVRLHYVNFYLGGPVAPPTQYSMPPLQPPMAPLRSNLGPPQQPPPLGILSKLKGILDRTA